MVTKRAMIGIAAGVCIAAGALVAPALGATEQGRTKRSLTMTSPGAARFSGSFTPAAADPRLAAVFARSGLDKNEFRFTPADLRRDKRAITVAVRARSNRGLMTAIDASRASALQTPTVGIAPIAYSLGASVGWKRFAVSGNTSRIDNAMLPGSREAADLAVSYRTSRTSSKLSAEADRPLAGSVPKLAEDAPSYSVDLSSSYSLTRNLDVTAGVRYRLERERLARLDDARRDSQAVYVGTAFRF